MTASNQQRLGKTLWAVADQLRGAMAADDFRDYNLNISRYISTAQLEPEIDLAATHYELVRVEQIIQAATRKHNEFLKELGVEPLPWVSLAPGTILPAQAPAARHQTST